MRNHYLEKLDLSEDATKADIKSAYRRLSKRYHPDISKDPKAHDKFIAINEAYKFLTQVGPQSTYSSTQQRSQAYSPTYDFDPYQHAYDEHRRKAKAYAQWKAKEAARRQHLYIKNILRSFNVVALGLVIFNVLLITDALLPTHSTQQEIVQLKRTGYNQKGQYINRSYDDVHFEKVMFRFESEALKNIDPNKTVLTYTSPIFNIPRFADFQTVSGHEIRRHQSYSVLKFFSFLIFLICGAFIVFRFVPQSLDSQLTWAVFMVFAAAMQYYFFQLF